MQLTARSAGPTGGHGRVVYLAVRLFGCGIEQLLGVRCRLGVDRIEANPAITGVRLSVIDPALDDRIWDAVRERGAAVAPASVFCEVPAPHADRHHQTGHRGLRRSRIASIAREI